MVTALIRAAQALSSKPNKILAGKGFSKPITKPIPRVDVKPKPRITVRSNSPKPAAGQPTTSRTEHQGNREQPERTYAEKHGEQAPKTTVTNDAYTRHIEHIIRDKDNKQNIINILLAGAAVLSNTNSILSNFIPSTAWTGACSARGFRDTPLRTVLHYCLAVAFSAIKQDIVGGMAMQVDLHPTENRVDVKYSVHTTLVGNLINLPKAVAEGVATATGAVFNPFNPLGPGIEIAKHLGDIKKYLADLNPAKALQDFLTTIANVSRRLGAGGVWDMATDQYFAGKPPVSMGVGGAKAAPFTDMEAWRDEDKRPLLTKDITYNPQAPKYNDKHFPTHFDLRSLVAQALYDPGVLPPTPNTLVGLPNVTLP